MDDRHGIVIGDIVEIERIGDGLLSVEWRIPNFLSGDGRYQSRPFRHCDGRWILATSPNALSLKERDRLNVALIRLDPIPPKIFHVTLGIRGAEGLENKKVIEQEFSDDDDNECWWVPFCTRSKLERNASRLMPGNELVIACDMRCGGTRGELPSDVLVTYSYQELQTATQNFDDLPLRAGGCKIGAGGFGTVYRAVVRGDVVAVKRLKDPVDKLFFMTELMTATNCKHENLMPLIGFSMRATDDGQQCCLLYEYMPNGSLQDRLACADGSAPLSWQTRLSISYGTALGINHLHTFGEKPMVHRDIKSANILLDQNFVPKVADFVWVRTGSSGRSPTEVLTEDVCGTLVYMPREAFMGDVSVKWDTFSFGVVLLELLTGLPPFDPNREEKDLVSHMYMYVCEDILPRLDPRAEWNQTAATDLYRITRRCLEVTKRSRPCVSEILEDLRKLSLLR